MLTIPEAAARLRVSKYTVYRMIHNGTLPAIKTIGKNRLRVDPTALEQIAAPRPVYDPTGVDPDTNFLTPTEVAGLLRCSVETVRAMVNGGQLRAMRNPVRNSHIRIPYSALQDYVAGNTTAAA